jgi:hypothetical protein
MTFEYILISGINDTQRAVRLRSESVGLLTGHIEGVAKMEVLEGELAPIGEVSLR